jgi:hypothetical protein
MLLAPSTPPLVALPQLQSSLIHRSR